MDDNILNTKFPLVLGGFLGFGLVFVSSFSADNSFAIALQKSSIGCVIGTILGKFFSHVLLSCMKSLNENRQKQKNDSQVGQEKK